MYYILPAGEILFKSRELKLVLTLAAYMPEFESLSAVLTTTW
jgi:hypothetical protein